MPELPEVETVVRALRPSLLGTCLFDAWLNWPPITNGISAQRFSDAVRGSSILRLGRRGKYITIALSNHQYIVIHLRMTGRLYISDQVAGHDPWVHFSLSLDNGSYLNFSDARKFGRVELLPSLAPLEAKLGPEPFDLPVDVFFRELKSSKRAIKSFLLDQSKIAGVGNIYADEALHASGIRPTRRADRIALSRAGRLLRELQRVLRAGIKHEGATIGWYRKPDGSYGESQQHFLVYGKAGTPCSTCGTAIRKIVLGQRGTHFCGHCQH